MNQNNFGQQQQGYGAQQQQGYGQQQQQGSYGNQQNGQQQAYGNQQQATGQQDALDKGVDMVLKKLNKGQSTATTEKISDGIRSMFKKVTGKDIPIQDKS